MGIAQEKLAVKLGPLELATPIISGSGCFGFGLDFQRIEGFDVAEFGGISLKGTTLHARDGNPTPRVTDTAGGMLNSIGLQNPGVDIVVRDYLPEAKKLPTKLIANISGQSPEEYGELAMRLEDGGVDAIELNISCPNVSKGGMDVGTNPEAAYAVVAEARRRTSLPLITKLTPNVTDITAVARATVDAGTDILSLINTLSGMAIDVKRRRPVLGNLAGGIGGLSGPAIKPVALLKVRQVHLALPEVPIIGQGGAVSATDAVEFFLAGASAVSIGTGLFSNPFLAGEINAGLLQYLQEHGFEHVSKLTGALEA